MTPTELSTTTFPDEVVFLAPQAFALRKEGNRLQFRLGSTEWQDVTLARLFPFSEPDGWISVLTTEGKEVGIIQTLKGLPREELLLVRRELARRYLVPFIQRITHVKSLRGIVKMSVETDRGRHVFFLRDVNENIKQPFPGYLTLTDVDGNRYDLPDLAALDPESRRLLDVFL